MSSIPNKWNFLFAIVFLFLNNFASAQSVLPPHSINVYLQVAPNDTTNLHGMLSFTANTRLIGKMVLTVQDTTNIGSILVKVGVSDGDTSLFQKNFTFDNPGNFTDGTSYHRKGFIVYLGMGSFIGLNNFYAEALLSDGNNNWSTAIKFHK